MITRWKICPCLFLLIGILIARPGKAAEPVLEAPADGDRVLFFGDSITQGGTYIVYIQAYLMTRFPDREIAIVNHGISSETISGTSEPDHEPRRPDAHDRFDRDVAAWKPSLVIACFGMNDGNYHPFERERFARYRAGVNRLIQRVQDSTDARLILVTPPPFDPYQRRASDPMAREYGYRYPAIDYDRTLTRYSRWLMGRNVDGVATVDVHAAMNRHLKRRRASEVSFHLAPDAVHPNRTGHWLMAQTILDAWRVPAVVEALEVNAASAEASNAGLGGLTARGGRFTVESKLPMPMDDAWDEQSVALERVKERFNQYSLKIKGLEPGSYTLRVMAPEDEAVTLGSFSAGALSEGLDLMEFGDFPTVRRSHDFLKELETEDRRIYDAWRRSIGEADDEELTAPEWPDMSRLRSMAKPMTLTIEVTPES